MSRPLRGTDSYKVILYQDCFFPLCMTPILRPRQINTLFEQLIFHGQPGGTLCRIIMTSSRGIVRRCIFIWIYVATFMLFVHRLPPSSEEVRKHNNIRDHVAMKVSPQLQAWVQSYQSRRGTKQAPPVATKGNAGPTRSPAVSNFTPRPLNLAMITTSLVWCSRYSTFQDMKQQK